MNQVFWGALCSLITLIPGVGSMQAIVCASLVPGAELYALVCSLIMMTVNEGLVPSGNPFVDQLGLTKVPVYQALAVKVTAWFFGIAFGIVFASWLKSFVSGGAITSIVISLIILGTKKEKTNWLVLVTYLVGVALLFKLSELLWVGYPAYVVGISVFSIPSLLAGMEDKACAVEHPEPDYMALGVAGALGLFTPGISSAGIASGLSSNPVTARMTVTAIDPFTEAVGLSLLLHGVIKGKTLVASVSGYIGLEELIACCILVVLAASLAQTFKPLTGKFYLWVGLIVNIALIWLMTGWVTPSIVLIGYGCFSLSKRLGHQEIALTFLMPTL